jgi:hypothetical protein
VAGEGQHGPPGDDDVLQDLELAEAGAGFAERRT